MLTDPAPDQEASAPWDVIGYAEQFSIRPGDALRVMVSSQSPAYSARVYRLGGPEPQLVRTSGEGTYPGRVQKSRLGSYVSIDLKGQLDHPANLTVHLWMWPTVPIAGRAQGLVTRWQAGRGWGLFVGDDGCLVFKASSSISHAEIKSPVALRSREWYEILCSVCCSEKTAHLTQRSLTQWNGAEDRTEVVAAFDLDMLPTIDAPLLVAASELDDVTRNGFAKGHYEGKIDGLSIVRNAVGDLAGPVSAKDLFGDQVVGDWDFSIGIDSTVVHDSSPNHLHGLTVNMPTRGMTGNRWDTTAQSPTTNREHYSAIHFHSDDFEDAGWESDIELHTARNLASGAYIVRLSAQGTSPYEIPFFVTPKARSGNRLLVLLPTFTYLAYGNDHLWGRSDVEHGVLWPLERFENPDPADPYLVKQRDLGLALYDHHVDGSGCCYASRLRPLVNMRPDYRYWQSDGPRHFSADLLLLQWLERRGFRYDVITDEELHHQGLASIKEYKALLTGSHPEYYSLSMLLALESYLDGGGKLMYLGGNGFYWVTSVDLGKPHVIEVRRGVAGSRNWSSEPGELHHSTTGELGGLWRHRGRRPNELVGVGFSAMGYIGASGYVRLPASRQSELGFIFEGVRDDEVIGDFGTVLGGAAGDELDRYDPNLGSPFTAVRLATTNALSSAYQLCVEDMPETVPNQDGVHSDRVRADMTYLTRGNGGAVFSVGSINWISTLGYNNDSNNVSRVTENVVRAFIEERAIAIDSR